MSILKYSFNYNLFEAMADFTVDTDIFTVEHAKEILEFFAWDYDKEAFPIDEVMKKYAMRAIFIATGNSYNAFGVMEEFKDMEGFYPIDGSAGITLDNISGIEFEDDLLDVEIIDTFTNEKIN